MIIPGINHAINAENAVSNKSIFTEVYTVMMQQAQQSNPPHNIGLNLQAAPDYKYDQ